MCVCIYVCVHVTRTGNIITYFLCFLFLLSNFLFKFSHKIETRSSFSSFSRRTMPVFVGPLACSRRLTSLSLSLSLSLSRSLSFSLFFVLQSLRLWYFFFYLRVKNIYIHLNIRYSACAWAHPHIIHLLYVYHLHRMPAFSGEV